MSRGCFQDGTPRTNPSRRSKYRQLVSDAITANGPMSVRQLCEHVGIDPRDLDRLTAVFLRESLLIRGPDMPSQRTRGGPATCKTWDLFVGPVMPLVEPRTHWTPEQTEFIRKHYGSLSAKDIGRALGKSASAVQAKAEREKLVCPKPRRVELAKEASKKAHASAEQENDEAMQIVVRRIPAPQRCPAVAMTLARLPALDQAWKAAA